MLYTVYSQFLNKEGVDGPRKIMNYCQGQLWRLFRAFFVLVNQPGEVK